MNKQTPPVSGEEVEVFTVPGRYLTNGKKNRGADDVVLLTQHQRITEALRGEVERAWKAANSECNDWAREFEKRKAIVAERDQLRAEVELLKAQLAEEIQRRFDGNEISSNEHREEVQRLQAQLAQQQGVLEGWISVTERLPEVAQEVIVSTEFEGVCAGILDSYGEWFAPCSEYKLTRVTHWMPLPAAPEVNV